MLNLCLSTFLFYFDRIADFKQGSYFSHVKGKSAFLFFIKIYYPKNYSNYENCFEKYIYCHSIQILFHPPEFQRSGGKRFHAPDELFKKEVNIIF